MPGGSSRRYLKLDYNINPGAGTDVDAAGAGAGLLAHSRAVQEWLTALTERHPGLTLETCSSGAMRADFGMVGRGHLQSTSDQQDFRLYPPIAASAPMSIPPEQCGNWAYPAAAMTEEEAIFTLVTGLSGRLYLSGFLDELSPRQRDLVREAVDFHRARLAQLEDAIPFWPLGLPSWDDDVVCVGLRSAAEELVFVWTRGSGTDPVRLPGVSPRAQQVFPSDADRWAVSAVDGHAMLHPTAPLSARVLRAPRHGDSAGRSVRVTG